MVMRIFFGVSLSLLLATSAEAAILLNNTYLVDQIKPNPTARSKPTFPQFASVQFLPEGDINYRFKSENLTVEARCKMAGYHTTQSACSAKGYKYGARCSDDNNMNFTSAEKTEAAIYVAGCCSNNFTVTDPTDCTKTNSEYTGNSCLLGQGQANGGKKVYECICNRSTYPYGDDVACPSGYSRDETMICTVQGKSYYKSCCPTTGSAAYIECKSSEHKVGNGNSCVVNGKTLYQNCVCASRYNYNKNLCSQSFLINEQDVCIYGSTIYTYPENCYVPCSQDDYQDLERYYENKGLTIIYDLLQNLGLVEE